MIARVCSFLAGVALIGAPALAGMPASWTRADLPQGHGTIATPCSDDERVAVSDRTIYCQADGVTFVVDISTAAIFMNGEYREQPYELVRDDLLAAPETRRLVEGGTAGLRSFRSDGSASDGGIGMGLVELRPDLMLTVMVRIVGEEVEHSQVVDALDDIMDSLEIAPK